MDYHPFKARLNRFMLRYVGGDRRPAFFEVNDAYPSLGHVTPRLPGDP